MLESSKKSAENYRNPLWVSAITENEWNESYLEVSGIVDRSEVYKSYMVRMF